MKLGSAKIKFGFISSILLYVGCVGMLLTISQYLSFSRNVGFLEFKQAVYGNPIWRFAFYCHVFSCVLCLFAGFTQFSDFILINFPGIHRTAGRIYFYNILLINFPVGFILAVNANGNLPGRIAFVLLDMLWTYFTIAGVYWIKKGDRSRHRQNMIRSYALTLTALTLRLCKMVMAKYSGWSYNAIYVFDAWTAISVNLLIAEIIIRSKTYRVK